MTPPARLVSEADCESALEWAESAGQRIEVSERPDLSADLRERYRKLAARDMGKARAFLGLPEQRPSR